MNSKLVIDISKAILARFSYVDQYQRYRRSRLPSAPTFENEEQFDTEIIKRMHSKGMLDIWIPQVELKFNSRVTTTFTGKRAVSIWQAWCELQFGKKCK